MGIGKIDGDRHNGHNGHIRPTMHFAHSRQGKPSLIVENDSRLGGHSDLRPLNGVEACLTDLAVAAHHRV